MHISDPTVSDISLFVDEQLPSFYQEDGPIFVEFVKAYYEFLATNYLENNNGPYFLFATDKNHSPVKSYYYPIYLSRAAAQAADPTSSVMVHRFEEYPDTVFYMNEATKFHAQPTKPDGYDNYLNTFYNLKLLRDYVDIDRTLDDFIENFKSKYMLNLPSTVNVDERLLIKKVSQLYKTKGTESSIKLLFKLIFGENVDIFYPGNYVIKPSNSNYVIPTYLELEQVEKTKTFLGKEIYGITSGARAFVEDLVQYNIKGTYIDVVYLSNVRGLFQYNELITNTGGTSVGSPKVIGSLSRLDIINGGANNTIGQIFNIVSTTGIAGRARVDSISSETGRVSFILENGGSGYTVQGIETTAGDPVTKIIVSNNVITSANVTANLLVANATGGFDITEYSNTDYVSSARTERLPTDPFQTSTALPFAGAENIPVERFDRIIFPMIDVEMTNASEQGGIGDVELGTVLQIKAANGTVIGNGQLVFKSSNTTPDPDNNIFKLSTNSNYSLLISAGSIIEVESNTDQNCASISVSNATVVANSTGSGVSDLWFDSDTNNKEYGIHDKTANVYVNCVWQSLYSNLDVKASGYVANVSTGISATFAVGSLTNEERLTIYTDLLKANNDLGVPFLDLLPTGENNNALYTGNTDFFAANGAIQSFTVLDGGYGYDSTANNDVGISSSSGSGAAATFSNDALGTITSVTVSTKGELYQDQPTLTFGDGTSNTSTANVVANFGLGFPLLPIGSQETLIIDLLSILNANVGTIASLTAINPGQDYNKDPFVVVINEYIAGFNRGGLRVDVTDVAGVFEFGELIDQSIELDVTRLTLTSVANTVSPAFSVGEGIIQDQGGVDEARGVVVQWNADDNELTVDVSSGAFNSTAGNTSILGTSTGSTATINANTDINDFIVTAKGRISSYTIDLDSNGDPTSNATLFIERLTFNTAISESFDIVGQTSGATANVALVQEWTATFDAPTPPRVMGDNAVVSANVQVANNVATSLTIIDSGFAHKHGEVVTLSTPENPTVITANTQLVYQGIGEGYWKGNNSKILPENRIHDNYRYQDFSYEVKSGISLDKYSRILKDLTHVAGTKMFGNVEKTGTGSAVVRAYATEVTLAVDQGGANSVSIATNEVDATPESLSVTLGDKKIVTFAEPLIEVLKYIVGIYSFGVVEGPGGDEVWDFDLDSGVDWGELYTMLDMYYYYNLGRTGRDDGTPFTDIYGEQDLFDSLREETKVYFKANYIFVTKKDQRTIQLADIPGYYD